MRRIATALLDLLTGDGCAGCGLPGPPLCDECVAALPAVGPTACDRCGHPWPVRRPMCPECIAGVATARQALMYDGRVPAVVGALKDSGRRSLAAPLASVMASILPPPPTGAALVPVPLAPRREADRGFNQAALLARELCLQWGIPLAHALGRSDGHGAQRGSAGAARRAQVQGAFHVVGDVPLHCVLVDDVVTTGSTLSSAARALRAGGCARVGAVALARVALRAPGTRVGIRQIQSGGMRTWNSM